VAGRELPPDGLADGRPGQSWDKAGTAAVRPARAAGQPVAATDLPAAATDLPAAATGQPAAATDQPASAPGGAVAGLFRRSMRLREHLSDPLFRNAYALMINTGTTGLLGLVYWLLAARHYAAADVGRASAAYAAMNLLAGITALSLTGALARFIPQSGGTTRALILRAYAVSAAASLVITVPFLLTVGHWGSSYSELGGVTAGFVFTAAVVAWAIFTLQDGVLIGIRSAPWVAIENGVFGVIKIVLLLGFAVALPHLGIYISWMLPVVISLPLVNMLIFRRLIPRHERLVGHRQPPTNRQVGRFVAGDFTGSVCLLATANLVPIVVAMLVTPGTNAYFYIAWTIGTTVDLLAINMAMSLTVESAFHAAALAANTRTALRRTLLILVPIAALTVLLAPWGLGLFGPGYAHYGAPILQLLALATLPKALTELYFGALRAQSRTSRIAIVQVIRAVLLLGLALVLTRLMGIVGAGVAVLASQLITMILILPGLRAILAGGGRQPALTAAEGELS
jgi:O-antigen/teichoic acid export membrane protein